VKRSRLLKRTLLQLASVTAKSTPFMRRRSVGWPYFFGTPTGSPRLSHRALAIDEKNLGPEHPNVASDLNNLADLLRATNRFAEAETLMRRALTIDDKSLGPQHPNVATALNNLAGLLLNTNRPAEAEPLMRRALIIGEKNFGPEHPQVAIALTNR
jgi:tetratricopeptide (TPR) repeat protein